MSESFNLFRLQQLDLNRMKIRRRQREIEKILNADESVQKAQQMLDANHQELEKATHAYNEIHDQVEERNLKLKYSQAKLFGGQITNPPKELRDLEAESAALKSYLSELAEQQFYALEALEKCQNKLAKAEENLAQVKSASATKHSKLMGESRMLEEKLPAINEQRESLRAQISPANYQAYVKLLKSKGGRAVAEVIDSSCNACGVNVPLAISSAPNLPQKSPTAEPVAECFTPNNYFTNRPKTATTTISTSRIKTSKMSGAKSNPL